jgi:alcohol dehydrogenase
MKAAVYEKFRAPLSVIDVPDPTPGTDGVVMQVKATGVCRSDWHGWMGHDDDIRLPHVPGHEIAGVVSDVGKNVRNWSVGDRVTLPFVCGCGNCPQCESGNQQVCDHQSQPGFTHWGSYAEYVAVDYADTNLVALPDDLDFVTAASLGCRFATSYRATVEQGKIGEGQWFVVYGCGGVGLSAVMIASALGARVLAIDIDDDILEIAKSIGAEHCIRADTEADVAQVVREISAGGAHVSMDALGSKETCSNSIKSLRKRGKHVQVGLMAGDDRNPGIPMHLVVANELEILGSHGMQAHKYGHMLDMIITGQLNPAVLVGRTVGLTEAASGLGTKEYLRGPGVTVIDRFGDDDR